MTEHAPSRPASPAGINHILTGRATVLAVAAAMIVFRTLVYLLFEQVSFDSDQAIVGLMAKHLSQGRAFPLFVYGQTYMLGVESWVAAPFFLVAGATVRVLRISMLAWNVAFGVLLLVGLQRDAGLRPWTALVPALFFVAAPASVASQLISAQGGIVPPFVYIAALWFLRHRGLAFGVVLAVGFRHREFTLYAVPVLVMLEIVSGELTRGRVREWLISGVAFVATWESIEALKPFADFGGPGTRGQLLGGFSGSQIANLLSRFDWQPASLLERVGKMGPQMLAWFTGARQVETALPLPSRPWLLWTAGLCLILMAGRVVALLVPVKDAAASDRFAVSSGPQARGSTSSPRANVRARPELVEGRGPLQARIARAQFPLYMFGVGAMAVAVFLAGKPVLDGYSRYVIYGLLVPVGVIGTLLVLESRELIRRTVVTMTVAWGIVALVDHATVLAAYVRQPPPSPAREVADRLVAQHVPAAAAGYWRAYLVTFLSRERVPVASTDIIKIQEYQDAFANHRREALRISDQPCPDGEFVGRWYLCKP